MYSVLGNSYNEIKEYENSDKSYEKSLEYLPENVMVLNNYILSVIKRREFRKKQNKCLKGQLNYF